MNVRKLLRVVTWLIALNEGEAVEVFSFQEDGVARVDTQAVYMGQLNASRKMSEFTMCGRIKIFFLHDRGSFFQLRYDEEGLAHMLKAEVWLDKVRPVINRRWQFQMLPIKLRALKWYHLCFTYSLSERLYQTYLEGNMVYDLIYDVERPVYGDFARIGQNEEIQKSFSGQISQVNIWDRVLTDEQIKRMAECENDEQGNYISWNAGWRGENAKSFDIPLRDFCASNFEPIVYGFPNVSNVVAYYVCSSLGTHLTFPKSFEEVANFNDLVTKSFTKESSCRTQLWTSLNDDKEEGKWLLYENQTRVSFIPWDEGEPNGIQYENCGLFRSTGIYDGNCKTNIRCAVCNFQTYPVVRMVGDCELKLQNMYYVVYQRTLGELFFRGYSKYIIEMIDGRWVWYNRRNNQTMAKMIVPELSVPHYPMGRRVWELESTVCNQQSGERTLLLTHCDDDEFTCDDAKCIPLMFRCDQKYDCLDNSDETNCDIVLYPDSYKKSLTPRSNDENLQSLPIILETIINSIEIDTIRTTMTLAFEFRQTWFDNRLQFVNLKNVSSLNRVDRKLIRNLWIPEIAFVNTPDNRHTLLDSDTEMTVNRLNEPTMRTNTVPEEMDLYDGAQNTIMMSKHYSVHFVCEFDLSLYPFDEQFCDMRVRIESATSEYLHINQLNSTVLYLGTNFLIEYEIESLTILEGDQNSFSEILFRIHMLRRYGFAVLTIYIPSLILLAISYVTLFFTTGIFEVRVMAALTALLVVATIFTQASASLPKTSYFKFVDIWLLFCIGIIFLIIIFHTVIDRKIHNSKVHPFNTQIKVESAVELKKSWKVKSDAIDIEKRYIRLSRVVVMGIFLLFNLVYWGIIFF